MIAHVCLYGGGRGTTRRQLGFAAPTAFERVLARTPARAYLGGVVHGHQAVVCVAQSEADEAESYRNAWR